MPPTLSKTRKSTEEHEPVGVVDLHSIDLDDEHIDENCDQVRRKINRLLDSGAMTKTAFAREIGVSGKSLTGFLGTNGPFKGAKFVAYRAAWEYLKKREMAGIKLPAKKPKTNPAGEGSSSTAAAGTDVDISDVVLPGEEDDAVPIFDTCDEVRRKVNAHLKKPGVTQAQFCRDIYAQLKGPARPAKSFQSSQLSHFRNAKGALAGVKSALFYGAYVFFEKRRVKEGKPKNKHRLEMEQQWDEDGIERNPSSSTKAAKMGDSSSSVQPPPPPKRKLVSVREISKVERIPGFGKVAIHLDGWKVLVVGDLVVFFEIDSFIPKVGRFWELFGEPNKTEVFRGKEGYRVKSRRDGKHLSQGLIYPLVEIPEIDIPYKARLQAIGPATATDELLSKSFSQLLGVEKWEFTETAETLPNLGRPPAFIHQPGWSRIQDVERMIFSRPKQKKTWQITEKLDGITMTVYKFAKDSPWADCLPALPTDCPPTMQDEKNRYGVCNRREDMIDRDDNLYWQTAKKSGVLNKLHGFGLANVAVQGEFCGHSVEGNTMNYPEGEHEFIVFGIWNIDTGRYLHPKQTVELCKKLGIKHVPVLGYSPLGNYARDVHELLEKAEGKGKFGGVREGFVFKSTDGTEQFKVISNSWLSLTGK
ncbi:RNA ligase-domain-containing protein [Chaetomidium leptoderma]|uniref:RNA ligase-domain-containing protein n=1 Tax=Chaetomidium leptoderma TaxID=669021 RepID=A0AAN6VFR3_9PEZI|nr:RNA ligase-domain-containing protein [Chaetomidium leptoderma]